MPSPSCEYLADLNAFIRAFVLVNNQQIIDTILKDKQDNRIFSFNLIINFLIIKIVN